MTPKQARSKDARLQKKYGITLLQYNLMLERQAANYALCGKHQSEFKHSFHVDHNHKSGKVRGLVCFHCNHQLIRRHNVRTAVKLLNYMAKHDPES